MLIDSVEGTVTMTDGTRRAAWKNTYRRMVDVDGGASMKPVTESRIEFRIFTNANATRGARYRKASDKQAATFVPVSS
jgi:hypothetical protein